MEAAFGSKVSNVSEEVLSTVTWDPIEFFTSEESTKRVNRFFLPWNNPENIVSQETSDAVLFVIDCILCPLFTVLGVTGNLMSFIVLLQNNMRGAVDIVLSAMVMSDTLFLISTMIRRAKCIISTFDYLAAEWFYVTLFNSMFYLNIVFSRITTLLTVLISANRFIAVLFPMKARVWCTRSRMLWAVLIIYILCFLILIPLCLYYEVDLVYDSKLGMMKPYLARSTLYVANHDFLLAYSRSFLVIMFRYIPAVVLVVLNGMILITIKRSSKERQKLGKVSENQDDDNRKVTRMLLVISCLFLLTLLPGCAILLGSSIDVRYQFMSTYHNLFLLTSGLGLILEVINSSVNFILYMLLSKTFSATYWKLFCCKKRASTGNSTGVSSNACRETSQASLPSISYTT